MKVLVTGAAGFIGSAMAQRLEKMGHVVVGIDNFNDYYNPSLKVERAGSWLLGSACDISSKTCADIWRAMRPDIVYHFAAQAGVRHSKEHPGEYINTNIKGTQFLLEMNAKYPAQFVFISSSSVYNHDVTVATEASPTGRPSTLYGASKIAGEMLCHAHAATYGNPILIVRPFTVYGPWGRPDMAVWRFTQAIEQGSPIDLYGDGEQYRDFTYIDDLVAALYRLTVPEETRWKGDGCEAFNICKGNADHLRYVVKLIGEALDKQPAINSMPMQYGDVPFKQGDNTKLMNQIGYAPSTPIEEGVGRFVEWFKGYRGRGPEATRLIPPKGPSKSNF